MDHLIKNNVENYFRCKTITEIMFIKKVEIKVKYKLFEIIFN